MNDLSAAERCVKCGLCLPHCPTFRLTGNEADSPRGRISLMQMLEQPDTDWSPGLFRHLDQCLMCHACEAMCPSGVPFGSLMDTSRELLQQQRRDTLWQHASQRTGLALLTTRSGRKLTAAGLSLIRPLSLHRLPGMPASIRRLLRMLPEPAWIPDSAPRSAMPAARGRVSLFTGCTGDLFDSNTLDAARHLLDRLGYTVEQPRRQGCCGALHQHGGRPRQARQLALGNLQAFADNSEPVLAVASGCCVHLQQYADLYPETGDFSQRATDVIAFLADRHAGDLAFRPLQENVALYLPCTQRNVLGTAALGKIMTWIPQLGITTINPDGGCCGAAGSYMLTQPELSERLGEAMVDKVVASGCRILLSTNIGCSLQLRGGLRQRGVDVEIIHPLALLSRQLA